MGCHFLLQGVFLTQRLNPGLPHCRQTFYPLSHQGSPVLWMWDLNHKEGWVPKNWCFWTVVLDKTLESLLDCKEIKPVNPQFSSAQFTHSVVSDSLRRHGLQYPMLSYLSLSLGVCSNSCPLSWWCHPTITPSVVPFSSHHQSFPASGSFQMSQLFASGGRSIGVSASTSVLPMNTQDWFALGWTGWISLQSKGLSSLFQHHSSKASVLQHSAFFIVQHSHPYVSTRKIIALTRWTFVGKVTSLLFNILSSLVILLFHGVSVF